MTSFNKFLSLLTVLILPLFGRWLADSESLMEVLSFDSKGTIIEHSSFSYSLNLVFLCLGAVVFLLWLLFRKKDKIYRHRLVLHRRHYPWWRFPAYAVFVCFVGLLWSRVSLFELIQPYANWLVWMSFIIVLNLHVHRLSSRAPMVRSPGRFLSLFLVSASGGWLFVYMNGYAQNWQWVGLGSESDIEYLIQITLTYSIVLPAVFSTFRLLYCSNRLHRKLYIGPGMKSLKNKLTGIVLLIAGVVSCVGIGYLPRVFFPFIWISPLLLFGGLQIVFRNYSGMNSWRHGDWRWVGMWGLAGLFFGALRELWNFHSLVHWEYQFSLIEGIAVFELPLLGYLAYIPIGVLCGLIIEMVYPEQGAIEFSPNS